MLELSIDYNSVTETLLIKAMPTRLLGCHLNWMRIGEFDWLEQNLVTHDHLDLLSVGGSASQSSAMDHTVYDIANSG